MRLLALSVGLTALVALLVACAGDNGTTQATGVAPASAEAAAGGTSSDLSPQATEEPPLAARVNGEPITLEEF